MKTTSQAKSWGMVDPILTKLKAREMSPKDTRKAKTKSTKSIRMDLKKVKLRLI